MVNENSQEFTLWKANLTPKEDIVAVDSRNNIQMNSCTVDSIVAPGNNSSGNTPAPSSTSTNPSLTSSNKLSAGAIAGITVGCLTLFVLLGALSYWFSLRRKRTNASSRDHTWQKAELDAGEAKTGSAPSVPSTPQELNDEAIPRSCLGRHELPT